MGYRSEVAYAFYSTDEEHKGVITLWLKENLPFDAWDIAEYWNIDEGSGKYVFHALDVKWYADDPEVLLVEEAGRKFIELFCRNGDNSKGACEHVRIGENTDDMVSEYHGNAEYILSISRSIHIY
jgi:hypothetical protein